MGAKWQGFSVQLESKGVIKQMTPKLKGWIFLKTGNKGL